MESVTVPRRPYLRIYFACCNVYQRVYRHLSGTHYQVRCPRCLRSTRVAVGPQGIASRDFIVR